ncbi:MAG: T9SS C-terminal target domain-containing protein [Porphyromonadaceae bacterium]|nr:MAG: T9SS C-terminal target domain-containing protein [Porphyromonadaceae bacterium]
MTLRKNKNDFMKFKYIVYIICFLVVVLGNYSQAQERLVSVTSNPVLINPGQSIPFKSGIPDTLQLPIRDDFSGFSPYPESIRWTDYNVNINHSFAINPPTYGVATFDAIDSTGTIYSTATVQSFLADALTSLPVNLFLPRDTTIYLSFYYQPQGIGDAPEPEDSLVVEFYAPDNNRWFRIWSTPGSTSHDFRIVMINITDSRFLQKGFRFRFRNYASLSPSYEPSLKVNADHWNLDYVYLNNGRHYNDTIMQDAALVQPVGSLLLNYTAMPWEHFKIAGISAVKAIFQVSLNNLSSDRRVFSPVFRISPVWVAGTGFEKNFQSDEVKAFQTLNYDAAFNYGFTSDDKDSALFEVSLDLNQATPDWIPGNDKIVSEQIFSDYYAYDDGSSEAGYGLVGEGSRTAKLAYRFNNLKSGDSLFAVDFFFNRSFADASRKYFRLAVWADDNNKPGELLYDQDGAIPEYNGINKFQRIKLDTAQVVTGTYYVGWLQTTADFLNVGFDRQNNHGQDIFFNISGTWQTSEFEGSLMIRPVFANKSRKSGIDPADLSHNLNNPVKIYPNPSNDLIRIDCGDQSETIRITLTDLNGRIIRNLRETGPVCKIAVSDLPNGIYLIQVQSDSGIHTRQKLIIIHE